MHWLWGGWDGQSCLRGNLSTSERGIEYAISCTATFSLLCLITYALCSPCWRSNRFWRMLEYLSPLSTSGTTATSLKTISSTEWTKTNCKTLSKVSWLLEKVLQVKVQHECNPLCMQDCQTAKCHEHISLYCINMARCCILLQSHDPNRHACAFRLHMEAFARFWPGPPSNWLVTILLQLASWKLEVIYWWYRHRSSLCCDASDISLNIHLSTLLTFWLPQAPKNDHFFYIWSIFVVIVNSACNIWYFGWSCRQIWQDAIPGCTYLRTASWRRLHWLMETFIWSTSWCLSRHAEVLARHIL